MPTTTKFGLRRTCITEPAEGLVGVEYLFAGSSVHYSLIYQNVSFARRDDLVFQVIGENDYYGLGHDSTRPTRADAERCSIRRSDRDQ